MNKIPDYVKESVVIAYNGYCACKDCYNKAIEVHHIKANTKANNLKWSLFMQSPFNLVPICRPCHGSEAIYQFKITDKVAQMFEDFLQDGLNNG